MPHCTVLEEKHVSSTNYIVHVKSRDELAELLDKQWPGPVPYTLLIAPGGKVLYRAVNEIDPWKCAVRSSITLAALMPHAQLNELNCASCGQSLADVSVGCPSALALSRNAVAGTISSTPERSLVQFHQPARKGQTLAAHTLMRTPSSSIQYSFPGWIEGGSMAT